MPSLRLQGLAFLLLMGWGVWQGIAALSSDAARSRLAPVMTGTDFLAGRTAAAINHVMAHALPADAWLRAAGGSIRYVLFRSGGPQVRLGCDGWLFLTEELRPWDGAAEAMAARTAALARIEGRLREQGVALAVVLVPDKARVQSASLCGAPLSEQAAARHDAAFSALRAAGLARVVPLLPALTSEPALYYRTDTHWNQRGAALAASAVVAALGDVDLARDKAFRTEAAGEETDGPGDLLRLMGLDRAGWPRPAPDRERRETTTEQDGSEAGGGLLDDTPAPEVALVGSSYSLNANFHGRLQEAIQGVVFNGAKAGGGFAGAAREYFTGPTFAESPPRLVIWEIPERVLVQPIEREEREFLARW
ncbi:MAG: cell division protein FtsQ [Acetobacteraceae bacterium]|nr:cell division protein FtsQ [Acetobacteraceae bacterium]